MLKRVVVTNYLGESMEYTIEGVQPDSDQSGLLITSIDGLGPVKANINMTELATTDGGIFNSARLSTRNIVIKGLFTNATSIEDARLLSYQYFPIKGKVTLRIETDNRTVEAVGYVESNEPTIFAQGCGCQISILCEDSYFNGGDLEYELTPNIENSLEYYGDSDTGVKMDFKVSTNAEDPVTNLSATKDANESITIDISKMSGIVPNTSPTDVPIYKCFFTANEVKHKFIKQIPDECAVYGGFTHFLNGELHYFGGRDLRNVPITHAKWDSVNKTWVVLSPIPIATGATNGRNIIWSVVHNDALYVFDGIRIHKFDETNNVWETRASAPSGLRDLTSVSMDIFDDRCKGVSYGSYIYVFITDTQNSLSYRCSYNPGSNTWASSLSRLAGLENEFSFKASNVFVYDSKIHLISGTDRSTGYAIQAHRYLDGTTFRRTSDTLPQLYVDPIQHASVIYKNKIHFFDSGTHYVLDDSTWSESYSFPYGGIHQETLASDSDYIYIVGGTTSSGGYVDEDEDPSTYSEPPNNDHLIPDDVLTINTEKGKKSVVLSRGDNKYNVLNVLGENTDWFQFHRGVNKMTYTVTPDLGIVDLTVTAKKLYEGV